MRDFNTYLKNTYYLFAIPLVTVAVKGLIYFGCNTFKWVRFAKPKGYAILAKGIERISFKALFSASIFETSKIFQAERIPCTKANENRVCWGYKK